MIDNAIECMKLMLSCHINCSDDCLKDMIDNVIECMKLMLSCHINCSDDCLNGSIFYINVRQNRGGNKE